MTIGEIYSKAEGVSFFFLILIIHFLPLTLLICVCKTEPRWSQSLVDKIVLIMNGVGRRIKNSVIMISLECGMSLIGFF